MTNVLMFGDTAFVGSTIKNRWRDHGYQFKIYELKANNRNLWYAGMDDVQLVYGAHEIDFNTYEPDIIHIHFYFQSIQLLTNMFPNTPIILSLHGSDLRRGGWKEVKKYLNEAVKIITVSTEDLVGMEGEPEGVVFMPNAPDMALIQNLKANHDGLGLHLQVLQNHANFDNDTCINSQRVYQRRDLGEIYPRKSYLRFLSHFEFFHDHRVINGKTLGLSLTAIEFLAMGGCVHYKDEWLFDLPKLYNYDTIMDLWDAIYKQALS